MQAQVHDFSSLGKETENVIRTLTDNHEKVLAKYGAFIKALEMALYKDQQITLHDAQRIFSALKWAAGKHAGQTRKNKEKTPYIIHPIGVAYIIMTIGNVCNVDIIIGALLHDTVEDTDTTFEEIRLQFGPRIESLVRELTDNKSLSKEERKRLQIEHAPHTSHAATIIKLSDKLYNLTDLMHDTPPDWSQERVTEYFKWAQQVVDQLPRANQDLKTAIDTLIKNYIEKS